MAQKTLLMINKAKRRKKHHRRKRQEADESSNGTAHGLKRRRRKNKARSLAMKAAWERRRALNGHKDRLAYGHNPPGPAALLEAPEQPKTNPSNGGQPYFITRRVLIESPYKGNIEFNTKYARACMRDSLNRGEAPLASHLLYTQPGVLSDGDSAERSWGIDAGLMWGSVAHVTVVYIDLGTTEGMAHGISAAVKAGRAVEYRSIPGWVKAEISA